MRLKYLSFLTLLNKKQYNVYKFIIIYLLFNEKILITKILT